MKINFPPVVTGGVLPFAQNCAYILYGVSHHKTFGEINDVEYINKNNNG
jgi:hypothetical protein